MLSRSASRLFFVSRTFSTTPAKAAAGGKAAAKDKKVKKKESKLGTTVSATSTGFAIGESMPISIMKDAKDPVVLKDAEYPDWLWTSVINLPTIADLQIRVQRDVKENKRPTLEDSGRLERLLRRVSHL